MLRLIGSSPPWFLAAGFFVASVARILWGDNAWSGMTALGHERMRSSGQWMTAEHPAPDRYRMGERRGFVPIPDLHSTIWTTRMRRKARLLWSFASRPGL